MKKQFRYLLLLLFILSIANNAKCQIAISNPSEIEKIKRGTTFIAMNDTTSERVKAYIEVFKRYWTVSKIQFIKYQEIEKYLSPENSFLTIGGYVTTTQFITLYRNGGQKNGISFENTHLYLELWTCDDKYFRNKQKKREFGDKDKIQVARIELYTDFETLMDPDKIFQSNFDGDGHIHNWGPGILKNYVQSLMSFLSQGEEFSLYSGMMNSAVMKNLKSEVLYIPDYVLTKFNKFSGDETKKHDEKELFEDYELKYKIISIDELNEKILNGTEAFYYLIYIKSCTDKYVSVVNSSTGELIYSVYTPVSYNFKKSDMRDIRDEVQ